MTSRIVICPVCNEEVIAKGMIINSHYHWIQGLSDSNSVHWAEEHKCQASGRIINYVDSNMAIQR